MQGNGDYISRDAVVSSLNRLCDRVCQYSKAQRNVMCGACPLGDAFMVIEDGIPAADAIEELSKPRWIPVTEALPEDECPVLVTYLGFHDHKPRANMLAYIDRDLGWCWWDDDIPGGVPCSVEITHWRPLPEPPKEE